MPEFTGTGTIEKLDSERRVAYGWATVIEKSGEPVVDSQGDMIDEATLLDMAHGFIADVRAGKVMHGGRRVADLVESMVFTTDLQKALGIDLGKVGWMIAMKVRDEATWEKVKSGQYPAFSIGGFGDRVEV